jgi:hypothetical protein
VLVQHLPFAFDQTHTVNLVAGYELGDGWRVSGSLHFNTGRPESGEFSSRTMRVTPTDSGDRWAAVPLNQVDRLPPFLRLDAGFSKTWLFERHTLELHVDLLNVTLSQEVYGFDYGYAPSGAPARQPVAIPLVYPSVGLKASL